jgi:hypothetical protein
LLERLLPAGRRLSTYADVDCMDEGPAVPGLPRTETDRTGVYALNDEPQPQVDLALGLRMVKPPPARLSTKSTSAPFR